MSVDRHEWGVFERLDTFSQAWIAHDIFAGYTYPFLPFVRGIKTVVDIGANVGAAAVWFARCYPEATIYALEPAAEPFAVLARNAERWPSIHAFRVGLSDRNDEALLYTSGDTVVGSVTNHAGAPEKVSLRRADQWFDENVSSADLLKIDTEGCEIPILECLGERVATAKLIYIEAHSESDRRAIDRVFQNRYRQVYGRLIDSTGEYLYVADDVIAADRDAYGRWIREMGRAEASRTA